MTRWSRVLYCSVTPRTSSSGAHRRARPSSALPTPARAAGRDRRCRPRRSRRPRAPRDVERALEQARERHRRRRLDDDLHPLPGHPHRAHDRLLARRADRRDAGANRRERARRRASCAGRRRSSSVAGSGSTRPERKLRARVVGVRRLGAVDADRRPQRRAPRSPCPTAARRRRPARSRCRGRAPPRAARAPPSPCPAMTRASSNGWISVAPVSRLHRGAGRLARGDVRRAEADRARRSRRTFSCFTFAAFSGITTHAGDAALPRRVRERRAVIAGRMRDDAAPRLGVRRARTRRWSRRAP